MSSIQSKAKTLLMEIKSLQSCDSTNTIGAFTLLNEILRDAESLAKQNVETPMDFSKRIKRDLTDLSIRSANAMERSRKAVENSSRVLQNARALTDR